MNRIHLTPVVKNLLIINIIVYVFMYVLPHPEEWNTYFMLFKTDVFIARPLGWDTFFQPVQLVTFFFAHGGLWHLVFNMSALASIGPMIEMVLGPRRFLQFYLFCGFVGGILLTLFDPSPSPVIGASGAIFGVMTYFAYYYPNHQLSLFFVLPPFPARQVVFGITVLSAVMVVASLRDPEFDMSISHFGHLTGVVCAMLYFLLERYIPFLRK